MPCKKRILFFVQDGTGLGHLRRATRTASALERSHETAVACAKEETGWFLPARSTWYRLPSWGSAATPHKIQEVARCCRTIVQSFQPDIIVVDYMPLGTFGELESALQSTRAKKYLIMRSVINTYDRERLFGPAFTKHVALYDRILVASDRRVLDVADVYQWEVSVQEKVTYIGYIMPTPRLVGDVRRALGVPERMPWVVCSAGAGKGLEYYLEACVHASRAFLGARFDVVCGPYAKPVGSATNCVVHATRSDLGDLHAACDVAVIRGGYNSLMEAISGGARVIAYTAQEGERDELENHTRNLGAWYPVSQLKELHELENRIRAELAQRHERPPFPLDANGVSSLCAIVDAEPIVA